MMLGTSKWTRTGGGWQPWSARKDSGRNVGGEVPGDGVPCTIIAWAYPIIKLAWPRRRPRWWSWPT